MGKLLAEIQRRRGRAFGRHLAVADAEVELEPLFGVGLEARMGGDSLQRESAGGGLALMAGLAILGEEGLGGFEGIGVGLRVKSCGEEC